MDRNPRPRLLLIGYEYPPAAEGSVQRVARFASLLSEHGWDVSVITARPVPGAPRDEALLDLVPGIPALRLSPLNLSVSIARLLRPFKALPRGRAATGASGGAAPGAGTPLSIRISRWVSVPDDARWWAMRVPRVAAKLHAAQPFDAVLATAPPYSAAVAATRFARRFGLPLVVDMQDPWRDNANIHWPTRAHATRALNLERECMSYASAVTAVSQDIADEAAECGAPSTLVLPNGFDAATVPAHAPTEGPLRLAFLGRLSPVHVDPTDLFRVMAEARDAGGPAADLTLDVYGPDAPWAEEAAARLGVADRVTFHGFVSYPEALRRVAAADIGFITFADRPGSRSIYTSKLFDYLGVGLPILLYGPPHSAAAEVIREYGGFVVPHGAVSELAAVITKAAEEKAAHGTLTFARDDAVRMRFDRRAQVAELAAVLREVTGH